MKKIIFIILAISAPYTSAYSQEDFDGFGNEGNGDAQTNAPNVPIDGLTIPLLATGLLLTIYTIRKRQLKQN